ncbi:MAG: peptide ABC transporter [Dehalococcoidales bacterium]|nr:peptide ABC transporter [Dehalococcoidales bacterium]
MSARYVFRRLLQALLILFLVSITVFLLIHIVPGDPARIMLGDRARELDVEILREQLGFDRPLVVQYADFIGDLAHGDFGDSIRAQRPTIEMIWLAVPASAQLTGAALLLAFGIGIPLGVLAAVKRGGIFDRIALILALIGQSIPAFWLGLVLIAFVSLRLGLLPTSGIGGLDHLILPAVSLAPTAMGMVLRVTRVSMIEVMNEDYVRTATAKGLHPSIVVIKHALKNASIPIITIMGLQVGALLGGAIITETVFAWPGVGRLAVDALIQRDWPVVRTVILLAAFLLVLINVLIDIIYAWIDKRVQFQ